MNIIKGNIFSKKKWISKPRGTQDIFSDRSCLFYYLREKIAQLLTKNNYSPIIFPSFEYESLFKKSLESSNICREMYVFPDRKGRMLALRPEGTLSVARVIYQNNLFRELQPKKLYYWANMFRYERPQKDRYREFWQLGVELLGAKGIQADFQILKLARDILYSVGLKKVVFRLNYIGKREIQEKYQKKIKEFLEEKVFLLCLDCKERFLKNPLRILDCVYCQKKINFPSYKLVWTEEIINYVSSLSSFLDLFKLPYVFDYQLVRGLDYYTGLVFEVYLEDEKKALLGGGRYDNLYESLGGLDIPSIGFALGIDRLINFLLLKERKDLVFKKELDVFFLNYYEPSYEEIIIWKEELLSNGFKVEYNLEIEEFKKKQESQIEQNYSPKILIIVNKESFLTGWVWIKKVGGFSRNKIEKKKVLEVIKKMLSEN